VALNPVPLAVAELTVTGVVPVDVSVMDWVAGVFRSTFPNAILVAFTLSPAAEVFNSNAKVLETLPAVAVRVAVCAVVTAATVAEKPTLADPAPTRIEDGTETDELLLARVTLSPPVGAAALKVTVHASVPAAV
jgi:hypothetical protein